MTGNLQIDVPGIVSENPGLVVRVRLCDIKCIRLFNFYFFEVKVKQTDTFNITKSDSNHKAWILADNARDIDLEISGHDETGKTYPGVVAELYVDSVLRNVAKLRTGR